MVTSSTRATAVPSARMAYQSMKAGDFRISGQSARDGVGAGAPTERHRASNHEHGQPSCKETRRWGSAYTDSADPGQTPAYQEHTLCGGRMRNAARTWTTYAAGVSAAAACQS